MIKERLIKTADELPQPGKESVSEFSEKLETMVYEMNKKMLGRPDIEDLVGKNNKEMMKDNHANHARFMESVFMNFEPEVLVYTILWVFRAYRSRNFSSTYWAAQLNSWIEIYQKHLSKNCFAELLPFYKWMQVNIPVFNSLAEKDIDISLSSH